MSIDETTRRLVRSIYRERMEGAVTFDVILDTLLPTSDEETAEVIRCDQLAANELGLHVSYDRYRHALSLDEMQLSRGAAIKAHAMSLYETEEVDTLTEGERLAKVAASVQTHRPSTAGGRTTGRRRRAAFAFGIWTPIQLVLMFSGGIGMTIATLYWKGVDVVGQLEIQQEQSAQIVDLTSQAEALRAELRHNSIDFERMKTENGELREFKHQAARSATLIERLSAEEWERTFEALELGEAADIEVGNLLRTLAADTEARDDDAIRQRFIQLYDEAMDRVRQTHAETEQDRGGGIP